MIAVQYQPDELDLSRLEICFVQQFLHYESVCGLSLACAGAFYFVPLKSHGNPDVRNDLVELKIKLDIPVS